jgi:hypothetical protein
MIKRKGQIAPSLTWFFAFMIIFFLIIFFTGGTLIAAKAKSIPVISWIVGGKSKIGLENHANEELAIVRKFESFANSPVKINGNIIKVKNMPNEAILFNSANEKVSAFIGAGKSMIDEIKKENADIYRGIWIRVYDGGQITELQEGTNKIYAVESGKCDPASKNTFITGLYSTLKRRIILCVEYD